MPDLESPNHDSLYRCSAYSIYRFDLLNPLIEALLPLSALERADRQVGVREQAEKGEGAMRNAMRRKTAASPGHYSGEKPISSFLCARGTTRMIPVMNGTEPKEIKRGAAEACKPDRFRKPVRFGGRESLRCN